jgi:hypothetical protein
VLGLDQICGTQDGCNLLEFEKRTARPLGPRRGRLQRWHLAGKHSTSFRIAQYASTRSPLTKRQRQAGSARTEHGNPAHTLPDLLDDLGTLSRNEPRIGPTEHTSPASRPLTDLQATALQLLGIKLNTQDRTNQHHQGKIRRQHDSVPLGEKLPSRSSTELPRIDRHRQTVDADASVTPRSITTGMVVRMMSSFLSSRRRRRSSSHPRGQGDDLRLLAPRVLRAGPTSGMGPVARRRYGRASGH